MSLAKQIDTDLIVSMKGSDKLKLSVLRMAKSALKLKQVESGKPLDDAEALAVFRTLVKQRREAALLFREAGRPELAEKEEAEIKIVEAYLPAAASDEELDAAVMAALAETGATNPKETGKVMKAAMAKLAGKTVDGKRVNELVRARLGGP
ncbi:MAG TPA: GatB/YqeY domain-containing protein [Terriglobia bacterium]|nr:GatB/YqeY domain-containing protein [Terriglobia bacterium]